MIIHLIPHPVSAKRFVEPLVRHLRDQGAEAELWVEQVPGLENFYRQIDCPKRSVAFNLSARPWRMVAGAITLFHMFRESRPLAVEAHLMRGALIPLFVAWLLKVPVRIYHNHGVPFVGYRGIFRWLLKGIEKLNCFFSTHILTVSEGMRNIMVEEGLATTEKCKLLGPGSACGIDLEGSPTLEALATKAPYKQALDIAPETFVVLYVGRPHRRKGFDTVLSVWQRAFLDRPVLLLMAGIDSDAVARRVFPAPENIHPLGYKEDLEPYYLAADVVVLPSEHEGFGYSLLEGAVYGCCPVACRIPGPDAIIRDGETGLLIAPGSMEALEAALIRLEGERAWCRKLGLNARINAARFDRDIILESYGRYMRSILLDRFPAQS